MIDANIYQAILDSIISYKYAYGVSPSMIDLSKRLDLHQEKIIDHFKYLIDNDYIHKYASPARAYRVIKREYEEDMI